MPVTDTLRECHRLRRHLRDLQAEIDRGPRVLKTRQEALEAARQEHAEHYESLKRLKLQQREDEGTLKQTEARLAKLEEQLSGISAAKEYAAKQAEIAHAKARKSELEDAILETMAAIEEKTAQTPAVEQKWAAAQAEFAEFQREAAERLERLLSDQAATRQALAQAEATLPDDVRAKYDTLVKAHGPEALAALRNRTCLGCRTALTEQKSIQVRGGLFTLCPTCGKILYPEA